MMMIAIDTAIG